MHECLDRRSFMARSGAGLIGAGLGVSVRPSRARAADAESQRKPNILMIVAEDMGPHLGCYGDSVAPTPRLDALAKEGVLFRNAYVTQASCSPSRSSIFTGLYPHQNNQLGLSHLGYRMYRGIPNLPQLLKADGYRTGILGKLHVSPDRELPFDVRGGGHGKDVRAYATKAAAFIDGGAGAPFFLSVNFGDCHKVFAHQHKGIPSRPITPDRVRLFPEHGEIDTRKLRDEVAGYYNGVQRVDAGVGLLLDLLGKRGLADNTIVMFLGDHGPPVSRGKTTTYELGVRIPLIVRWPGVSEAGRQSDALVSTVDLLPTCVNAAGGSLPSPLAGRDFQPLLAGEGSGWRKTLVTEWHTHGPGFQPQRAIRDDRYKLILNLRTDVRKHGLGVDGCAVAKALRSGKFDGTKAKRAFEVLNKPPSVELYDLETDPIEYRNLAGKPELREVEGKLKRELHEWRVATRDPFLDQTTFDAYRKHADAFAAALPERRRKIREDRKRKGRKGRIRIPIDMSPFQRDWADVCRDLYQG